MGSVLTLRPTLGAGVRGLNILHGCGQTVKIQGHAPAGMRLESIKATRFDLFPEGTYPQ